MSSLLSRTRTALDTTSETNKFNRTAQGIIKVQKGIKSSRGTQEEHHMKESNDHFRSIHSF